MNNNPTGINQYTRRGSASMAKASKRVKKHENRLEKAFKAVDAGKTTRTVTKLKTAKKLAWGSRMAVSTAYKEARYGKLSRKK